MKFKKFNFKIIKSTNDTAARIIKKTNYKFGMVVAEKQFSGRGQYGRKWISYKGNLFASFFHPFDEITKSDKKFLITGIGINVIKNPNIKNYPSTNLYRITGKKINKSELEKNLKLVFENRISKMYKIN